MKTTTNIIKRILSEETEIQNVDTIIDDVDIDKAIDVEEEIEIPEVILNLEKNPPKWYIKLKRRIALRTARRSKRPNYKGQSDYKRKKQNKKVAKYVPLGVMAEAAIVAALYVFNKKFKNFVNNLGNSFLNHMGSDARIEESRDYSDKEQVKDMIVERLIGEVVSIMHEIDYDDLQDILTKVYENSEFLFMDEDSYLSEQREFNRSEVDIDVVLELMKYKYGYGDLASGWIEEFEEELGNETLSTINSLEYADLLHRFIQKAEEDSRRYDDRINYNSGHAGYDDRNYQYGNKPDDYYSEDDIINLDEQMEFEPKGMDFWLEELSEFAIHLENGVYDKHDELSFDDLTEYDIGEIQRILEDAMEDKTLNDNERTLVFEYGQGIIDSIQRTI